MILRDPEVRDAAVIAETLANPRKESLLPSGENRDHHVALLVRDHDKDGLQDRRRHVVC